MSELRSIKRLVRPSHLEPCFDLCVSHFQPPRQRSSLGGCQILLLVKSLLELRHLNSRERRSWFFSLRRRSILIWMTDAAGYWEGWNRMKTIKNLMGESNLY